MTRCPICKQSFDDEYYYAFHVPCPEPYQEHTFVPPEDVEQQEDATP